MALCHLDEPQTIACSVPLSSSDVSVTISGISDDVVTVVAADAGSGGATMSWQCQDGEEASFVQVQTSAVVRSPGALAAVSQRVRSGVWK